MVIGIKVPDPGTAIALMFIFAVLVTTIFGFAIWLTFKL